MQERNVEIVRMAELTGKSTTELMEMNYLEFLYLCNAWKMKHDQDEYYRSMKNNE